MDGDIAETTTNDLTSTMGSVQSNKNENIDDPPPAVDSVPSSSSDANNAELKLTNKITDDSISSTSDVEDKFSKTKKSNIEDEAELFANECNISYVATEKITENVEDIVTDLENLLGGPSDFSTPINKKEEENEEWFDAESTDALNKSENIKDPVESTKDYENVVVETKTTVDADKKVENEEKNVDIDKDKNIVPEKNKQTESTSSIKSDSKNILDGKDAKDSPADQKIAEESKSQKLRKESEKTEEQRSEENNENLINLNDDENTMKESTADKHRNEMEIESAREEKTEGKKIDVVNSFGDKEIEKGSIEGQEMGPEKCTEDKKTKEKEIEQSGEKKTVHSALEEKTNKTQIEGSASEEELKASGTVSGDDHLSDGKKTEISTSKSNQIQVEGSATEQESKNLQEEGQSSGVSADNHPNLEKKTEISTSEVKAQIEGLVAEEETKALEVEDSRGVAEDDHLSAEKKTEISTSEANQIQIEGSATQEESKDFKVEDHSSGEKKSEEFVVEAPTEDANIKESPRTQEHKPEETSSLPETLHESSTEVTETDNESNKKADVESTEEMKSSEEMKVDSSDSSDNKVEECSKKREEEGSIEFTDTEKQLADSSSKDSIEGSSKEHLKNEESSLMETSGKEDTQEKVEECLDKGSKLEDRQDSSIKADDPGLIKEDSHEVKKESATLEEDVSIKRSSSEEEVKESSSDSKKVEDSAEGNLAVGNKDRFIDEKKTEEKEDVIAEQSTLEVEGTTSKELAGKDVSAGTDTAVPNTVGEKIESLEKADINKTDENKDIELAEMERKEEVLTQEVGEDKVVNECGDIPMDCIESKETTPMSTKVQDIDTDCKVDETSTEETEEIIKTETKIENLSTDLSGDKTKIETLPTQETEHLPSDIETSKTVSNEIDETKDDLAKELNKETKIIKENVMEDEADEVSEEPIQEDTQAEIETKVDVTFNEVAETNAPSTEHRSSKDELKEEPGSENLEQNLQGTEMDKNTTDVKHDMTRSDEKLSKDLDLKAPEKVTEVVIKTSEEPAPENIVIEEEKTSDVPSDLDTRSSSKIDENVKEVQNVDNKPSQELSHKDIATEEYKLQEVSPSSSALGTDPETKAPNELSPTKEEKISEALQHEVSSFPSDEIKLTDADNKPSLELSPKGIAIQEENIPEIPHLEVPSPPSDLGKSSCSKVDEEVTASDITASQEQTPEDITTKEEEIPEVLVKSSSHKIDEKVMDVTASDIKASQELTPVDIATKEEKMPEVLVTGSSCKMDENFMEVTASDIKAPEEPTPEDITTKVEEVPEVLVSSPVIDEKVMEVTASDMKTSQELTPEDITTKEEVPEVLVKSSSCKMDEKIMEVTASDIKASQELTPEDITTKEEVPEVLVQSSSCKIDGKVMEVTASDIKASQELTPEDSSTKEEEMPEVLGKSSCSKVDEENIMPIIVPNIEASPADVTEENMSKVVHHEVSSSPSDLAQSLTTIIDETVMEITDEMTPKPSSEEENVPEIPEVSSSPSELVESSSGKIEENVMDVTDVVIATSQETQHEDIHTMDKIPQPDVSSSPSEVIKSSSSKIDDNLMEEKANIINERNIVKEENLEEAADKSSGSGNIPVQEIVPDKIIEEILSTDAKIIEDDVKDDEQNNKKEDDTKEVEETLGNNESGREMDIHESAQKSEVNKTVVKQETKVIAEMDSAKEEHIAEEPQKKQDLGEIQIKSNESSVELSNVIQKLGTDDVKPTDETKNIEGVTPENEETAIVEQEKSEDQTIHINESDEVKKCTGETNKTPEICQIDSVENKIDESELINKMDEKEALKQEEAEDQDIDTIKEEIGTSKNEEIGDCMLDSCNVEGSSADNSEKNTLENPGDILPAISTENISESVAEVKEISEDTKDKHLETELITATETEIGNKHNVVVVNKVDDIEINLPKSVAHSSKSIEVEKDNEIKSTLKMEVDIVSDTTKSTDVDKAAFTDENKSIVKTVVATNQDEILENEVENNEEKGMPSGDLKKSKGSELGNDGVTGEENKVKVETNKIIESFSEGKNTIPTIQSSEEESIMHVTEIETSAKDKVEVQTNKIVESFSEAKNMPTIHPSKEEVIVTTEKEIKSIDETYMETSVDKTAELNLMSESDKGEYSEIVNTSEVFKNEPESMKSDTKVCEVTAAEESIKVSPEISLEKENLLDIPPIDEENAKSIQKNDSKAASTSLKIEKSLDEEKTVSEIELTDTVLSTDKTLPLPVKLPGDVKSDGEIKPIEDSKSLETKIVEDTTPVDEKTVEVQPVGLKSGEALQPKEVKPVIEVVDEEESTKAEKTVVASVSKADEKSGELLSTENKPVRVMESIVEDKEVDIKTNEIKPVSANKEEKSKEDSNLMENKEDISDEKAAEVQPVGLKSAEVVKPKAKPKSEVEDKEESSKVEKTAKADEKSEELLTTENKPAGILESVVEVKEVDIKTNEIKPVSANKEEKSKEDIESIENKEDISDEKPVPEVVSTEVATSTSQIDVKPSDVIAVEVKKLSKEESIKKVKSEESVEDVKPVKKIKSSKNLRNKQTIQSIESAESSTDVSTTPKAVSTESRIEETESKDVTSTETNQSLETNIQSEVTPKEKDPADEKVVKKTAISEDISIAKDTDAIAEEVKKLSKEESTKDVKSEEIVEDTPPEDVKKIVKTTKSAKNLRNKQKIQSVEVAESSTDVSSTPKAVSTKSRIEETESKDITSTETNQSLKTNIQSEVTPKEKDPIDEKVVKKTAISEDISIEEVTDAIAVEVTKLSKEESTKEVKSEEIVEDSQPEDVKRVKTTKSAKNLRNKQKIKSVEVAESSTNVSSTPKAVSTKSRIEETESKDITSTETDQSLETNIQSEVTPKEKDPVDEKVVKKTAISEDISIGEGTDAIAVEVTKLSKEESTKEVKSEEIVEDIQPEDVKHVKTTKSARNLRNKQKIKSVEVAESSTDVSSTPKAVSTKSRIEETESKDITSTETDQSLETNIQSEVTPKEKDPVDEKVVKKTAISEDISIGEGTDATAVEVAKLSKEESTKEEKSEEIVEDIQPEDVKRVKITKSAKNLRSKKQLIEVAESSTDVSSTPKAVSTKSRIEETESKDITSTKTDQLLETNIPSEATPPENDSVDVVKKAGTSEEISIEERKGAVKRTRAEKKAAKSPEIKIQEEAKDIEDIKSAEEKATKEEVKRGSKRAKTSEEAKASVEVPPIKVIKSSPEVPKEEPKRMSRRLRGAAIEEIKPLEEIKPAKESPKEEPKRVSKRLKAADKSLEEVKVEEPAVSKKPKLITEEIKPDAAKKIDSPAEKRRPVGPKCSKRLEAKRALEKSLNSSSEMIDLDSDVITAAESSSNNQVTTSSEVEAIVTDDASQDKSEPGKTEDSTVLEELPDSVEEFEANKSRNSPDLQITEANVEEELVKAALEASFDDDCKGIEDPQEKTDDVSLQKADDALLKAAEDSLKRSNQQKEELALIQAAQESQKRENDALIQAANEAENNRRITRSKEEYKKPLNILVETHSQEISIVKEAESTTTEDNEPSTTDNKQVEYSSKMSKNSSQLKLTIRKNKTDDSSILKIYDPKEAAPVEISPSESETEVEESPIPKLIIKQSQCSPKILSPLKITIKPVIKPEEQTQKASPKLIIKPIVKPDEEIKDEKHHSPKITIKPIHKPVEDAERCNSPKITIKPLIKPTEASVSPKIKIKPILKPEEIKEESEERIVLKITKGNIPQQKELKKDETEKLAKIKLKFSKEGGHAHIVNEEKGLKRVIEEPETEAKKQRVEPTIPVPSTENIPVTEVQTAAPKNPPIETPVKPEIFSAPPPEPPKPEPAPEIVITPAPRKRGRPRKVPLQVREEFKDPKEDDPSGESPEGISGRPKRSCRGPSARTTLGIKTRKPRGRGRGRGRGMGARGNRSDSPSPKKEKITESKLKLLKEAAITAQITDSLENQDVEMKLSNRIISEDSNDYNRGVQFLAKPADLLMYEEETRMSADSRAQTPAKHVLNLEGVDECSMHSSATTESNKLKRGTRLEVHQEPDGSVVQSPEQLAEYYWGGGGPYMLQEQVAQFLGIKSFKRKYPGISRRTVDMQERDFIRESGLASEHMCDLGLTAVNSADILDIMYSDFQFKYEEYCKHQRDRQTKEITNKQKALSLAASQEKTKLDITQAAVESAAQWNANFNKTRKEERIACMDLQTFTINYPKGRAKQLNRPKIGNYPIALVPGQYTDYYKTFTPTELNNMPLNTMLYKPINIGNDEDSQSDGSGSESDSSSSGSDSSDSDSSDEDCNICSPGSAVASKKAVV